MIDATAVRRHSRHARTAPAARRVRVAVAGRGAVGGALLRMLQDRGPAIERAHGIRFDVVKVLARDAHRSRDVPLPPGGVTTDVEAFTRTEADLVVEAIGGIEPAHTIARHTLDRGRGFVTANKALVAAHGLELGALARRRGGWLAYEAAVAGGVPVIRVLRESLKQTGVRAIRGILNGTTNFILGRMTGGLSFEAALREAQELGFAEADPSRDLNGQDAADKIAILAWEAFGIPPAEVPIHRAGLLPRPGRIVADARALGGTARLLAEAVRSNGAVAAAVEPAVVGTDSDFAATRGEENLILIETRSSGTIRLAGPGAGGSPTASAVLSDMISAVGGTHHDGAEVRPGPDRRAVRWAISVASGSGSQPVLERMSGRARVKLEILDGAGSPGTLRALTVPTPRPRVTLLRRALESAGLEPVILRLDPSWDR